MHIDAQPSGDWFLQTSPELCMKELLAAGYDKIFQICKCFRQNERGNKHLPELTMLEWYCVDSNYIDIMNQCEKLIEHIVKDIKLGFSIIYQDKVIDIKPPWPKISVKQAFEQYADCSMFEAIEKELFDEIMGIEIEPQLGIEKPLFLYDYPLSHGALAQKKVNDCVAERFELYIAGIELCNAFSELNDPIEQRIRFSKERQQRHINNKIIYPMPENFLKALYLMPDAAGIALGIDRLIMLFANSSKIDNVVAFTPEELE